MSGRVFETTTKTGLSPIRTSGEKQSREQRKTSTGSAVPSSRGSLAMGSHVSRPSCNDATSCTARSYPYCCALARVDTTAPITSVVAVPGPHTSYPCIHTSRTACRERQQSYASLAALGALNLKARGEKTPIADRSPHFLDLRLRTGFCSRWTCKQKTLNIIAFGARAFEAATTLELWLRIGERHEGDFSASDFGVGTDPARVPCSS